MLEIFFFVCFVVGILTVIIPLFYSPKKKREGVVLIEAYTELIDACYTRIAELSAEYYNARSFKEKSRILKEQKKLKEKIRLTEIKIKGTKARYGL